MALIWTAFTFWDSLPHLGCGQCRVDTREAASTRKQTLGWPPWSERCPATRPKDGSLIARTRDTQKGPPQAARAAALHTSANYDFARLRGKLKGYFRCNFFQHHKYPLGVVRYGKAVFEHLTGSLETPSGADQFTYGAIWGPVKHSVAQYYFATGRGPSIETASALVGRHQAAPTSSSKRRRCFRRA
jgi:hypothetical protein